MPHARDTSAAPRPIHRRLHRWLPYLIPGAMLLAVALPHLGYGDFRVDTGLYAAVGLQAWRDGSPWTLMAGEQPYFNKPPLPFWIHGLVLRLGGPSLLLARLPTLGAALGCVLATVALARTLCGTRTALATGVVLALTIEYFRRVREISLDVWQLFFLLLAMLLAAAAARRGRGWPLALAGAPIGLALLCKPLMGLVAMPILGAWLAWNGESRRLGWVAAAGAVALAVAAPWHVSMWSLHGEPFLAQYFGREVLERATGERITSHGEPWWYYIAWLGETYWPWLVPFVLGLVTWGRGLGLSRDARAARLAVLWIVVWLVALSIFPDRRARYALPLWPAMAWIAGMWLGRWPWAWLRRWERPLVAWLAGGLVAIGVVLAALPVPESRAAAAGSPVLEAMGRVFGPPPDEHWRDLFAWMRAEGVQEVWEGALARSAQARLYLEFGRWPRATAARNGDPGQNPPEGALLLYHRRGGRAPGPNEVEVFRTEDLYVTRLGSGGWRPVDVPDPGE